jgi:hypothetical protein
MRPLSRVTPQLPPQAMKTYHVSRPLLLAPNGSFEPGSHWREATCREVDCGAYLRGWQTVIDVSRRARGGLPSGTAQANFIRLHCGRSFTAAQAGDLVTFTFPPGQKCFTQHRIPVGREPMFAVTGGDWRGNPLGIRPVRFRDHRSFVDDFGEHQDRLADRQKKG